MVGYLPRQEKKPLEAVVLGGIALQPRASRGSCQEYRGINSRLLLGCYTRISTLISNFFISRL